MTSKTARRAGLALAGLAVVGSSMVGLAGTAEAAAPAQSHSSTVAHGGGWGGSSWGGGGNNDEVAGVFRSYRQCRWAGIRGERYGRWEDFDCDYAGSGGWSGAWQSSWGQPFNQFWSGGGWRYRGVWVLRVDDCD